MRLLYLVFKGTFCSDILMDALLRTRPYEKGKGSAEKEHNILHEELLKLIEKRASTKQLVKFMHEARQKFENLIDKSKKRKPLIIMNGEIFVRSHSAANQDSIKLLEKHGLEVILSPTIQWIDYVNKFNIYRHKQNKNHKKIIFLLIKKKILAKMSSRLYAPFADYLRGRKYHDPEHLMKVIQKALVYDRRIAGEPSICIGETLLFLKGKLSDISGIYHVGPFGCMQETAATSKMQAMIQQQRKKEEKVSKKIIPIMDSVFGDSELPNLEAEIAAFAEKCYLKKELSE